MNGPTLRPIVGILVLAAASLLSSPGRAQEITSISAAPSPACVGADVDVRVDGTGVCGGVRVDFGNATTQQANNTPFPILFSTSYNAPSTYNLSVITNDPACTQSAAPIALEVVQCGGRGEAIAWEDPVIVSLVPEITGSIGFLQPGRDVPFLIFGERFPLPGQGGRAFFAGSFGLAELVDMEWGQAGTWAAGQLPNWITGASDHVGLLYVQTGDGWASKWHAVQFTAARDVKLLPQGDVEVLSCSSESSVDCCNNVSHIDAIPYFCFGDPGASISGSHENPWGHIGNDEGNDSYRISLKNGWVVDSISYTFDKEAGESDAFRTTANSPAGASTWDESLHWWVSPNDRVLYFGHVFISGPRGTSHK